MMLTLAMVFLVMALAFAVMGLSGVAVASALTFQILFYVCMAVFLITFIIGLASKPPKV